MRVVWANYKVHETMIFKLLRFSVVFMQWKVHLLGGIYTKHNSQIY